MNTRIRSAVVDAMTRLKAADVAGATAAIRRALAGQEPGSRPRPPGGAAKEADYTAPHARHLGEVLNSLREARARFGSRSFARDRHADVEDGGQGFGMRKFAAASGSLAYKLHVPADHAQRDLALLVMLHGCTQDPDDFARGTRMNALADEFGLIVAYPHQPRSANAQGCWNWFDARHQRRDAGEPAILAGLARELASEYKIDSGRIFVAGLSAGGAMADVLASTYPDVFSAAGIHSGLPYGAATDVISAFAAMKGNPKRGSRTHDGGGRTIIFHGTGDTTVHPSNADALFERARARRANLQEVTTKAVVNGKRVTRSLLGPVAGPTVAEYWEIEAAGHAWAGGDQSGSFAEASGPDASREMVRFFLET